jgi:hypothetical protein
MTKKDFIKLADMIIAARKNGMFLNGETMEIAEFCKQANPRFNADRWFDYIDGKCGPSGGAIK